LIFSTRHLNATPENRTNVEKFNTRVRFFAASHSPGKPEIERPASAMRAIAMREIFRSQEVRLFFA
jgi:hypothetical protein